MLTAPDTAAPPDATGVSVLVLLLRAHGIAADAKQLMHQYGETIGEVEILRCANELKFKARAIESAWDRLARTAMPAIAERRDGSFFIVSKATETSAIILDPIVGKPQLLDRAEFESQWNGRLILMTLRGSLVNTARRFDIHWFLQAMVKYRRLLSEVLIASFFLQLFALVSPLFFQVVIDNVLVHRSLTTLDVIVIGLLVVSVFESVLTALRTYVFSHTTNRIDVELGARLFKHLVGLPISYFEARRAGDSVARVRELENIRNFLTSSALTLVIDLLFTVRVPGRDGFLFADVNRHRPDLFSVLHSDFGSGDAPVSSSP
jgi:ATP-binding cassette, subfamily B, bacterial HlyB/CyaB